MYSNSNSSQGNFGSYSSNPQFAPNQYAQNFQQQQQQQQIPQQQQQQQQQQAPPSAGGGGGYVNAPMMQQQQQRPYSQFAAYGQYPNAPFRGNVSNNGYNNGGNRLLGALLLRYVRCRRRCGVLRQSLRRSTLHPSRRESDG